jgi:hypothetical protein
LKDQTSDHQEAIFSALKICTNEGGTEWSRWAAGFAAKIQFLYVAGNSGAY